MGQAARRHGTIFPTMGHFFFQRCRSPNFMTMRAFAEAKGGISSAFGGAITGGAKKCPRRIFPPLFIRETTPSTNCSSESGTQKMLPSEYGRFFIDPFASRNPQRFAQSHRIRLSQNRGAVQSTGSWPSRRRLPSSGTILAISSADHCASGSWPTMVATRM